MTMNPVVRGGRAMARSAAVFSMVLGAGAVAAACGSSSTSSSGSTSSTTKMASGGGAGLATLESQVSKNASSTFSATYVVAESSTGKTQTVTFAQAPPKSAIVTSSGSFLVDGSNITACEGSGSSATCTSLPSTLSSELKGLTGLLSPSEILNDIKGVRAQAAANAAGFDVSSSSATYGGLASSCVTVKGTAEPQPVTYCAADSSGVLTYVSAGGSTVTLQSSTSNPPASTFQPPAGATVETLPTGL